MRKINKFLSKYAFISILFSTTVVYSQNNQPEVATSSKQRFSDQNLPEQAIFFCGLSAEEVPTTLAIGDDGNEYPIIRWISTFESREGRTPEERCEAVSRNFQRAYNNGALKYIRGDRASNGLSTVCVATEQGGACVETLFTLPPGTNANQTVRQLWELSEGVRGPLYQTGNLYYLNIEDLVPLGLSNSTELNTDLNSELNHENGSMPSPQ